MQRVGAAFLVTTVLLVLATGDDLVGGSQAPSFAPGLAAPEAPNLAIQGVASCASTVCHHNSAATGIGRNEYTIWSTHDPHARAYVILYEEPARQIVQNLQGPDAKPPTENLLCLNCHVQPGLQTLPPLAGNAPDRPPGLVLADGVGCESCHGAAEKWLKTHYLDDWKLKTSAEKAALGLRRTKDLVTRAQICTPCHVGAGNLDVNHDLIAAGHPRLRFEYAAYLANLPKHWDDKKDRQGHPHFDTEVWAIGQIVSMQAALKLLEHRGETATKPWPELAEYDCFACHHVLADAKWRRNPQYLNRHGPGALSWGTWYYPLAETLAQHSPQAGRNLPEAELKALQELMQPPYTDANRDRAGKQAHAAAEQLAGWLPGLRQPSPDWDVTGLAQALEARTRQELGTSSWDQAAQLYLALSAQRPIGQRKVLLTTLWQNLEFPARYESPRGFDPQRLREKWKMPTRSPNRE